MGSRDKPSAFSWGLDPRRIDLPCTKVDMSFEKTNLYQCGVTLKNVFFALTLVALSCFFALEKN